MTRRSSSVCLDETRAVQRETVCYHRPIEHTNPGTHPQMSTYESRNEGFLSVKVCTSVLRGRISALLIYHGQGHQVAERRYSMRRKWETADWTYTGSKLVNPRNAGGYQGLFDGPSRRFAKPQDVRAVARMTFNPSTVPQ